MSIRDEYPEIGELLNRAQDELDRMRLAAQLLDLAHEALVSGSPVDRDLALTRIDEFKERR